MKKLLLFILTITMLFSLVTVSTVTAYSNNSKSTTIVARSRPGGAYGAGEYEETVGGLKFGEKRGNYKFVSQKVYLNLSNLMKDINGNKLVDEINGTAMGYLLGSLIKRVPILTIAGFVSSLLMSKETRYFNGKWGVIEIWGAGRAMKTIIRIYDENNEIVDEDYNYWSI